MLVENEAGAALEVQVKGPKFRFSCAHPTLHHQLCTAHAGMEHGTATGTLKRGFLGAGVEGRGSAGWRKTPAQGLFAQGRTGRQHSLLHRRKRCPQRAKLARG